VVPMVVAQVAALLVVTYWPGLSLWLPGFMR
jgi:TRAP-type C4-dicarboxylate transport system permease large subunit